MKWLLVVLLMAPQAGWGQMNLAQADGWVQQYASHYGVSAELVAALIDVESCWNPRAVSSSGVSSKAPRGGHSRCQFLGRHTIVF
jgi:soluble lytic murein transglycosylase-like protein